MSELKRIGTFTAEAAVQIRNGIFESMNKSLELLGVTSVGKYMIHNAVRAKGKEAREAEIRSFPVDPMRLTIRTGRLARAVQRRDDPAHSEAIVQRSDNTFEGIFGVKTALPDGVPYAAIHETGGMTAPHDIYPKMAKALRFMVGDKLVFTKHVHHPGSRITARPYLGPVLTDPEFKVGVQNIFSKRLQSDILTAMRSALTS